ncbi:unnamed protein product [Closterium sp. Naga37s-1]|nr:unnamed protein product [Closterium sp. Naga37s-1]
MDAIACRHQRYYHSEWEFPQQPATTPQTVTHHCAGQPLPGLQDLYHRDDTPHRGDEQQQQSMDYAAAASDTSASLAPISPFPPYAPFPPFAPPFLPKVLSACSAQSPRATPAGAESASFRRGDAPKTAHRRARSASGACGMRNLLPSPARGDAPSPAATNPPPCALHHARSASDCEMLSTSTSGKAGLAGGGTSGEAELTGGGASGSITCNLTSGTTSNLTGGTNCPQCPCSQQQHPRFSHLPCLIPCCEELQQQQKQQRSFLSSFPSIMH